MAGSVRNGSVYPRHWIGRHSDGLFVNMRIPVTLTLALGLLIGPALAACHNDDDTPVAPATTVYVPVPSASTTTEVVPVPSASKSVEVVPSESTSVSASPSEVVLKPNVGHRRG